MTYKEDDKVTFIVEGNALIYRITNSHLSYLEGLNNAVFAALRVDKESFCQEAYGYKAGSGDWPTFHCGDMAAANRVIEKLQKLINKTPTTFMGKLTQLYKSITRTEPEKTFISAGVLGEDLSLTQEGTELFINYLFNLNKDTFRVDVVDAIVLAQEKESK